MNRLDEKALYPWRLLLQAAAFRSSGRISKVRCAFCFSFLFRKLFLYHVEQRQGAQVGGTEMVQAGSITYPEKSHMETKVISAAYDEQVPDGYVCTGCSTVK